MTDLWDLPAGWRWATMGEVAKVVGGSTPKTGEPSYWNGEIPWITPDDLSGYDPKYIERGRRSITQAGYDSCSTQMVPGGTVLFTSRAPIGYVAIARSAVCTNQGFKSFVTGPTVVPDYLYWYLKAVPDLTRSFASGTTFLELSAKAAARLPVPVPPLGEQRAIVGKIEELLARLDEGARGMAVIQRRLQAYLGSFLSAVCGGQVVVSSPREWTETTYGELVDIITSGSRGWRKYLGAGQARFVLTADVQDGSVDLENSVRIDPPLGREADRTRIRLNDILVTIVGNVGRVALVRDDRGDAYVSQSVALTRPGRSVEPAFLELWLRSPTHGQAFFRSKQYGVGRGHLLLSHLREMPVRVPPRDVQLRMIEMADRRASELGAINGVLESATKRATSLRRKVLSSAFRGALPLDLGAMVT